MPDLAVLMPFETSVDWDNFKVLSPSKKLRAIADGLELKIDPVIANLLVRCVLKDIERLDPHA